ncbi:hypothetical protein CGT94_05115 [Vibrio metoecus]|uniref:hypothetical protein n=1 Tax=Vibrio metoecus TaxID=1481663 RepID=UPI0006D77505|nr:hypothetical protein [Vibrio metoecus]KQB07352.1 hypothetical protein XV93_03580 [Vibrio metoecus]PAR50976.1 hypothetical protein CGT94_05115 [Vibrio metoecus]
MSVEIISTGKDTTLMQRPCVTLKVQGEIIKDVTEIKLQESTVAQPSVIFQIGGGLNHNQIYFYSEPDLMEIYAALKKELKPQGIKFDSILTD